MKDFLIMVILGLIGMVLFVGGIVSMQYLANRMECADYAKVTKRETNYTFVGGCYIKDTDGEFYRYDEYKNRLIAQGQFKK